MQAIFTVSPASYSYRIIFETIPSLPGYWSMNTFLKVLGIIFLCLIAMKLAPILLAPLLIVVGLAAAGILTAVGVLWAVGCVLLVAAVVLTPVWLPIALLVGLIMLIVRLVRGPATV